MNTPIADMVAEMLKNCIPNETIILAVRTTELAMQATSRPTSDAATERRRAYDREYRRKERAESSDSRPTSSDTASLLREDKKHAEVEVKKERSKSRGSKLPSDWRPKDFHYARGAKKGMSRAAVDELADSMRVWCGANANKSVTTKADWDLTFTGWIGREKFVGNGINGTHANTAAGRATAKETNLVASLGRGAITSLGQNNAGRRDGQTPGSHGAAVVHDFEQRTKNAG